MYGPDIIVRSMSIPTVRDRHGAVWQYHPRSDQHSKVACWAILFDVLLTCRELRAHIETGEVVFGIHHPMRNVTNDQQKVLDLVLCTPANDEREESFVDLAEKWGIALTTRELTLLRQLPQLRSARVGAVRVALEAKACMTAHVRAIPRLFDELNSSHSTVHGSSEDAVAVGFTMVNIASEFISPTASHHAGAEPQVTEHRQPKDAARVIDHIWANLRRRAEVRDRGFDAVGIMVVDCANRGQPVTLFTEPPAPPVGVVVHYDQMVHRVAGAYASRFR